MASRRRSDARPTRQRTSRISPVSAGFLLKPGESELPRSAAEYHFRIRKAVAKTDQQMTTGPVREAVEDLLDLHRSAVALARRLTSYIHDHNRRVALLQKEANPDPAALLALPSNLARQHPMAFNLAKSDDAQHSTTSTMLRGWRNRHQNDLPLNLLIEVRDFAHAALEDLQRAYPRAVHRKKVPLEEYVREVERGIYPRSSHVWAKGPERRKGKRLDEDTCRLIQILAAAEIPAGERLSTAEIAERVGTTPKAVERHLARMRKQRSPV